MKLSLTHARKLGINPPKRKRATVKHDPLRDELLAQIRVAGILEPMLEVRLLGDRKWRWDLGWAWANRGTHWLLVEIQGGIWTRGAHARAKGIERDMEKLNAAQLAGHVCLQVGRRHIESGVALRWIEQALGVNP